MIEAKRSLFRDDVVVVVEDEAREIFNELDDVDERFWKK